MHRDLIQQSPEWFQTRSLKLTASKAQAIASGGKGLETLVDELMAAHLSSSEPDRFSSDHTDRGNELEPIARSMYELERGVTVETVGFIEADTHIGFSPDGLIGSEGGAEIKCPSDIAYYRILRDGEKGIDTKYLWQVQMSLLLSGRQWWDLAFYNPNFPTTLLVFRILPDQDKYKALLEGLEKGVALLQAQLKLFA